MPIPQWLQDGKEKYVGLTHKQIDCSRLVYKVLKDSGCTIEYLSTKQLNGKKGKEYYDEIDKKEMKPGDIILFDGHVGIVESYKPKEGTGKFFGSQNSTGPDRTDFGPGTIKGFDEPFKILRPKPQYCPKTSSLRDDDAVPDKVSPDDSGKPIAHALNALGVASKNVYLTSKAAGNENSTSESYSIMDKSTSKEIGSCVMTPTGCEMTAGDRKVVMDKISDSDVHLQTYAQSDDGEYELLGTTRIGDNDGITVRRPFAA